MYQTGRLEEARPRRILKPTPGNMHKTQLEILVILTIAIQGEV